MLIHCRCSEAPGSLAAKPFATVRLADLDSGYLGGTEKCQPPSSVAVLYRLTRVLELTAPERSPYQFVKSTW